MEKVVDSADMYSADVGDKYTVDKVWGQNGCTERQLWELAAVAGGEDVLLVKKQNDC